MIEIGTLEVGRGTRLHWLGLDMLLASSTQACSFILWHLSLIKISSPDRREIRQHAEGFMTLHFAIFYNQTSGFNT